MVEDLIDLVKITDNFELSFNNKHSSASWREIMDNSCTKTTAPTPALSWVIFA
jgi:hypothetical protein